MLRVAYWGPTTQCRCWLAGGNKNIRYVLPPPAVIQEESRGKITKLCSTILLVLFISGMLLLCKVRNTSKWNLDFYFKISKIKISICSCWQLFVLHWIFIIHHEGLNPHALINLTKSSWIFLMLNYFRNHFWPKSAFTNMTDCYINKYNKTS